MMFQPSEIIVNVIYRDASIDAEQNSQDVNVDVDDTETSQDIVYDISTGKAIHRDTRENEAKASQTKRTKAS